MNKRVAWLSTVVALASAPAWAQPDFLPAAALDGAGLVKFWQLQLPLAPDQRVVDAFLVDDSLYMTTEDGYAFAVHAHSGAIRWLRQVTRSGYRLKAPCHAGDYTIFVTATTAVLYDRISGTGFYDLELGIPAGSAAATDGQRFLFGGINQRFYAYDVHGGYEVWKTTTNGPISATPVVHGRNVYLASADGGVYACTSRDKRFAWQASTHGPNTANLAADEIGLYVASRDQSLYLFDLQFGQLRWRVRFGGPLYEPPVLTPKVAYQFCPDDGVVAINIEAIESDERLRWKLPRGRALLAVHEKRAYLQSRDETLMVVDEATGEIEQSIPTPGLGLAIPAPAENAVYLAGADGRIFCGRPKGAPFVRRDDLRRALLPAGAATTQPADAKPAARRATIPTIDLETRRFGPIIGARSIISRTMLGEKGLTPPALPGRPSPPPAETPPAEEPKPTADAPAGETPGESPAEEPGAEPGEEPEKP